MERLYKESKVEVRGWEARHYDVLMDAITLGRYRRFIKDAIRDLGLQPGERVLDLGAGTGRNACLMLPYLGATGQVVGWEIGEEMSTQFRNRCGDKRNVSLEHQRIDVAAEPSKLFDHVFISFVLHGVPHASRLQVLANARRALRPGGRFHVLDYAECDPDGPPWYRRWLFHHGECPLAADFVRRDWRDLLTEAGFGDFEQVGYFWGVVRLLSAERRVDSMG